MAITLTSQCLFKTTWWILLHAGLLLWGDTQQSHFVLNLTKSFLWKQKKTTHKTPQGDATVSWSAALWLKFPPAQLLLHADFLLLEGAFPTFLLLGYVIIHYIGNFASILDGQFIRWLVYGQLHDLSSSYLSLVVHVEGFCVIVTLKARKWRNKRLHCPQVVLELLHRVTALLKKDTQTLDVSL